MVLIRRFFSVPAFVVPLRSDNGRVLSGIEIADM